MLPCHLCSQMRHGTCPLKLWALWDLFSLDMWVSSCVCSVSPYVKGAVVMNECECPWLCILWVCALMSASVCPWVAVNLCECMSVNVCGHVWDSLSMASCVRQRGCGSWAELVTQPACWQLWQWRRMGEERERERMDLGHDRASRGRCDASLRRLHWLRGCLGRGLGGHNHGGLLRSRHSHCRCHGALLEEQGRDREINRTWRLARSKATENRRQAPQRSCHIWCPDFSGHRLTDKEEEGDVVTS